MLTLLSVLLPQDPAQLVLDRIQSFIKSSSSLSVQMKFIAADGVTKGTGRLVFERPNRTRFDIKIGNVDYSFGSSEAGTFEVERVSKRFDEGPPGTQIGFVPSRLTTVSEVFFPIIFAAANVREAFGEGATFASGAPVTQGSVRLDRVIAKWSGGAGDGQAEILADPLGRPIKIFWKTNGPQSAGATTEFFDYKEAGARQADFVLEMPQGFIVMGLPYQQIAPDEGVTLDLSGIGNADGPLAVRIKDKALLFVTAPDCVPSDRMRSLLKELGASFPPIFEISTGPAAARDFPLFVVDEARLDVLRVPATPSLYLVDSKAKLIRVWFGYDPAAREKLLESVRNAIAGKL